MTIYEHILDLLFPRRCPICGDIVQPHGELVCTACYRKVRFVTQPSCMKCGKSLVSDTKEYCSDCMRSRKSFTRGVILADYTAEVRRAITEIKYHNLRQHLDFFAAELIRQRGAELRAMGAQALIPVPLHPARRRERGFNQAEELARRLSPGLGIPVDTRLLYRVRKTARQKELDDRQRLANLMNAFRAEKRTEPYHTVILIDDIYTTGSTAEACTRALHAAGVQEVYVVCIAAGVGR